MKYFIVFLGLIRFLGDTFQIKPLDQLGFISGFSPLPLVFSDRMGIEDFAHQIQIKYSIDNHEYNKEFNQEAYANIEGPLTRVGVYAIALAYSPRFPKNLWENTLSYGFCKNGPLAKSIHAHKEIENVKVDILHLKDTTKKWEINFTCSKD